MPSSNGRTPEQIRADISAERARLQAELTAFGAEVKRTGRLAGSALGGLGSLLFLARLLRRRRRS